VDRVRPPRPELEATNRRNGEIWTGLGYQVRYLADLHPFAKNLGAVHSIKKYLAPAG
jgi:hypothetical protein